MGIESYYKPGYTIKRPVVTTVDGVVVETFSDLISVSGRMRALNGNEVLANERIGLITTHRFYCAVVDVEVKDRIFDSNKSKTYEIKFVKNPMEMDDHLEIDCELINV